MADGGGQTIRSCGVRVSTDPSDYQLSFVSCIIPSSFLNTRTETIMPISIMIVCDPYDISQALLLSIMILAGPVGSGAKAERVEVAEDWYMISICRCRDRQPPDPGVRGPCNSHKGSSRSDCCHSMSHRPGYPSPL